MHASLHQSSFEFIRNPFARKLGGVGPRDDEDIAGRRQIASATTKKFSNLPLDPIANDRVADLAAHRDPQSGFGSFVRLADNDEICRVMFPSGT